MNLMIFMITIADTIPKMNATRRTLRRRKHLEPYWNEELQSLWNIMSRKEKEFLKRDRNIRIKQRLHQQYVSARNNFDKLLRSERAYRSSDEVQRRITPYL